MEVRSEEGEGSEEDGEDQFDRRMKEEVKKKLGHVELSLEEEMDMEDNTVALRT